MPDALDGTSQAHPADLAEAALRESEISNALSTLADIAGELEDGNPDQAQVSADYLKEALVDIEDDLRAEVLRHMRTWITANANGTRRQIADMVGLPPEPARTKGTDDVREAALADCITQAATEEDTRRRDELILAAFSQLAHLGPLAAVRWRRQLSSGLGIDRKTFDQLLESAKAAASDHPNGHGKLPSASGGVYAQSMIKDGALHFDGVPLGNFAAKITHELIVDDGQNPPFVRYTIEGHLAAGPGLGSVDVAAEEFNGMAWLAKHWGARPVLYVSPSKAWIVRRAIQEVSLAEMARERVHTFTGWATVNGKRAFLTASGAITGDGFDDSVRVDLGNDTLSAYALPAPPEDAREAMQASLAFLNLAPLAISLPIWAAMYAAPLNPLHQLNAMIWVYGATQSQKSTITLLALTHFGQGFINGRQYKAPQDWISTDADIQASMFTAKDLPLVVDDFAPQSEASTAKENHKKAHRIVRLVGNRSARGRRRADMTQQTRLPPRCVAIATAEVPLYGQSIVGRAIFIPIRRGDVAVSSDGDGPLDRAQAAAGPGGPGLYAKAMAAYIRWLAANWDKRTTELAAEYRLANQFARSQFPSSQSRLMDYYAALFVAAKSALLFAREIGAVSPAEFDRLANDEWPAALVRILVLQSERVSGQSPVIKVCTALADLLAQGRCYLAPRLGTEPSPPNPGSRLIGWYDDKPPLIYLLTNSCLELIREYWQAAGEPLDIMGDALRGELHQAGLVPKRDADQYEVSTYIGPPGSRRTRRALVFDTQAALGLTGYSLWPDPDYDNGSDERPVRDDLL